MTEEELEQKADEYAKTNCGVYISTDKFEEIVTDTEKIKQAYKDGYKDCKEEHRPCYRKHRLWQEQDRL